MPAVYARLGPAGFGVWAVLSGLTAMLSVADLGLGSAIVRLVAVAGESNGGR